MSREKYERTGLTGKPIRSGGRKHAKERFGWLFLAILYRFTSKTFLAIEIDLRQPSMLHGKKGFERIVWACRNVLNASVTWLLAFDAVSQNSLDKGMMNYYAHVRLPAYQYQLPLPSRSISLGS
jgi:ribonucleases P/MRP protein subunit RPP40